MHDPLITQIKNTSKILGWSLFKVPLLFIMRPWVHQLSCKKIIIALPCSLLNKNHLNSMYLGSLVGGADIAAGLLAMEIMTQENIKLSLIFKDLQCEFFKRSHQRTFFICDDYKIIKEQSVKAATENIRTFAKVQVSAKTSSKDDSTLVALFHLTLSFKKTS